MDEITLNTWNSWMKQHRNTHIHTGLHKTGNRCVRWTPLPQSTGNTLSCFRTHFHPSLAPAPAASLRRLAASPLLGSSTFLVWAEHAALLTGEEKPSDQRAGNAAHSPDSLPTTLCVCVYTLKATIFRGCVRQALTLPLTRIWYFGAQEVSGNKIFPPCARDTSWWDFGCIFVVLNLLPPQLCFPSKLASLQKLSRKSWVAFHISDWKMRSSPSLSFSLLIHWTKISQILDHFWLFTAPYFVSLSLSPWKHSSLSLTWGDSLTLIRSQWYLMCR